ncbi:phospholipid-transporting ATPase IF-like [Daphnia pulex]|uniref:phospholipid-transporting ATPase IF-like n=1 Tax=Daphnia pulex TaxID=6669 RepID=UPI001EDDD4E2|nr:phospholipid-transporting ATPase IF-like [Daphnia pulex]
MENFRRWRRSTRRNAAPNRFIFVGNAVPQNANPPAEYDRQNFTDNEIVSSKYTALNFLPKNLFEQFRRIANFYFLCIAIIQIVSDSPTSPITSILPLIFVVIVTAVKQGYEDFLRHLNDRQVNEQLIDVVRNGELQKVKSKNIVVGDVLRIEDDDSFPCDLVLLSSSYAEGKCYLTTANLDGETNYKMKSCPKLTRDFNDAQKLDRLRAHIECQQPNVNLYQFVGTLTVYANRIVPEDSSELLRHQNTDIDAGGVTSLGLDNLLLRGARLKDTEYVYGCAVYTGQDTKLGLNSLLTNNKFSTVEKSMNYFLLAFLVLLILEIALCTMQKYLYQPQLTDAFYLGALPPTTFGRVMQDVASFLIIFNYVIPISLYVTLEMQKFLGTIFFVWDDDLYCPVADERALCNTSDLNEELGQVEYLLTDKTGTLTENCMEFRQCSIFGFKYVEDDSVLMRATDNSAIHLERVEEFESEIEDFFITLALCHTVTITGKNKNKNKLKVSRASAVVEPDGFENAAFQFHRGDYDYQASSPDEKALAEACQRLDVVYCGETNDICKIMYQGEERLYRRLHILEFDSDRKRMSVIVQFPDESIWLLCKGAESTVLPRCVFGPIPETESHIKDYAMMGLRTLAIAVRPITPEYYEEITVQLDKARQALSNREEEVSKVCDIIESEMTLLGATGVEDQLQDGVPETLESLRAAGIKVWVLTGDKLETAVNIAHSCGHFKRGMELLILSDPDKTEETLDELEKRVNERNDCHFGMVVDGQSLAVALKHHRGMFGDIAKRCEAVVCCRMSPIQKAEVVKLVKGFPGKPITAAIGDGANDVSMIQEAHIGLGLMGKEGRQAVRCADFAFARFRFLRKVLLVHGHWYYWRVSTLVQYFFYKNIAFITPVVFFTVHSAYSTQPVYDAFFLTFYNILFTSLPILIYGLFEQNFTAPQLLEHLHLYKDIAKNARMSWGQFFKWNLLGLWHAVVLYFGCYLLWQYDPAFFGTGITLDYWSFGTLIYHAVIFVVSIKLIIESRYWTALFVFSILISILGFIGLTFLYSGIVIESLENEHMLFVYVTLLSSGPSWLFTLFAVGTALLPDILVAIWETYSVGGGVLVNKKHTPEQILRKKLDRTFSLLSQTRVGKLGISKWRKSSSTKRPAQQTSYEPRRDSNVQVHFEPRPNSNVQVHEELWRNSETQVPRPDSSNVQVHFEPRNSNVLVPEEPRRNSKVQVHINPQRDSNVQEPGETRRNSNVQMNEEPRRDSKVQVHFEPQRDSKVQVDKEPRRDSNVQVHFDPRLDSNVRVPEEPRRNSNVQEPEKPQRNSNIQVNEASRRDSSIQMNEGPRRDSDVQVHVEPLRRDSNSSESQSEGPLEV